MNQYRRLSPEEIQMAIHQRCSAEDWARIKVDPAFDVTRLYEVHFQGDVSIGRNAGFVADGNCKKVCGLFSVTLSQCVLSDDVRIAGVGGRIHNYQIGRQTVIENIHTLEADDNPRCGNGIEIGVLNEAGGREVTLFAGLTAQIAFIQAMHKQDPDFQTSLRQLIQKKCQRVITPQAIVADHVTISNAGVLRNINIGAFAVLAGVSELHDGTILSCQEDPVYLGPNVIAREFIICEGAQVSDGALLDRVFIGQGSRVGRTFSGENSLFFANCEAFHSETCSIFAGPYSVTHHRSTLLIACLFSFYNAGSGTNQSNHMYKLGPVHQGVLERGCKTGSFSYLLLESHIPAFSVVIGKHMTNFDLPDFPFSYIADEAGKSMIIPGKNLFSIGTVRDGAKWPARDRRKAHGKRDLIIFDIFSPYTVEKMRKGRDILHKLYEETPKETESLHLGGAQIKRLLLRKGAKYYELAIDRYLIGQVLTALEKRLENGQADARQALQSLPKPEPLQHPDKWLDLCGLLLLDEKYQQLIRQVREKSINSMDDLLHELERLHSSYHEDEWAYICHAFQAEYGLDVQALQPGQLVDLIDRWASAASSLQALILADARIEFADFARISYGLTGSDDDKVSDFEQVRGTLAGNKVIQQCEEEAAQIKLRAERLKEILA